MEAKGEPNEVMMLLLARHPNEKGNKRFDKILHLKLIQKKVEKGKQKQQLTYYQLLFWVN